MNRQKIVILVIAGIGALGTFMPWINLPIVGSMSGAKGDGWISFGLFVIPMLCLFFSKGTQKITQWQKIIIITFGLLAAALGIWKIVDFNTIATNSFDTNNPLEAVFSSAVSIGYGLYAIVIAGIALVGYVIIKVKDTKNIEGSSDKMTKGKCCICD